MHRDCLIKQQIKSTEVTGENVGHNIVHYPKHNMYILQSYYICVYFDDNGISGQQREIINVH